jgi:hypothetical protein
MGHRSNFIIVEQQKADIYYSHWRAITIPKDIFWGLEVTLDYIRSLEPTERLLDDLYCEGAVLVDLDRHKLMFFGGDEIKFSPPLRRAFLPLLQLNWPEWKVEWLNQGLLDIANYLKLDLCRIKYNLISDIWEISSVDLEEDEEPDNGHIITVKYHEANVFDYGFSWDFELVDILSLGSNLIDFLETKEPLTTLSEEDVRGGTYINSIEKEIWIWWGEPRSNDVLQQIADRWPGWNIKRHTSGLPFQVELSGRNGDEVKMQEEKAIEEIVKYLCGKSPDFRKIMEALIGGIAEEGQTVSVNFHALQDRKPPIDPDEKQQIIQRLIESLTGTSQGEQGEGGEG